MAWTDTRKAREAIDAVFGKIRNQVRITCIEFMQHRAFVSKTVFKQLDLLHRWLCERARWIKSCVLIGYLARSAFPSFFPTRKTNSFSQSFLTQLSWLSFGFRTFLRPLMVRGSQTVLTVAATGNVPFHFLLIIPCDLCR